MIPSAWVRAAQARWTERPPDDATLDQIGADVAQGGSDNTLIARRHGAWFSGAGGASRCDGADAQHNAEHVARALAAGGVAYIDADGIGASTYHLLVPKFGRRAGGRTRGRCGQSGATARRR